MLVENELSLFQSYKLCSHTKCASLCPLVWKMPDVQLTSISAASAVQQWVLVSAPNILLVFVI